MIKAVRIPNGPYFRLSVVGSVSRIEGDGVLIVKDLNSKPLAWLELKKDALAKQMEEEINNALEAYDMKEDYDLDWSFLDNQ